MLSGSATPKARSAPQCASASCAALLLAAGSCSLACFSPDDGREPPLDRIYFPTGIALSPDGERLYVANSDWDLQFNAGSVQVYDAAAVRELLPRHCRSNDDCSAGERCDSEVWQGPDGFELSGTFWCVDEGASDPCRGLGVQSAADRVVQPGLCNAVENQRPELLLDSVGVGAFATDLIYRANPAGGGRLFVPVRSDATLHWIDVRGGAATSAVSSPELWCGQVSGGACDAEHRRHDAPATANSPAKTLPIEPFGVDADAEGRAVLVTHQTEGSVSLFINDWNDAGAGPRLTYILDNLPARPIHVSAIPPPRVATVDRDSASSVGYRPGFWLAFRSAPFTELVRYFDGQDAPRGEPFLETAFIDVIGTTAGSDIRAIAVDASRRATCEATCEAEALDCLRVCAGVELDVFLANRSPSSLLIGTTTSIRTSEVGNDRLHVSDAVPMDNGPSKVVVGRIRDEYGALQRRVFLTSFDARSVTIYDPDAERIEARVLTGRGPSAIAIDEANALAYVAHFTDSYIGVIDLDRSHASFGTLLLALGEPTAPRGDP